MTASQIIERIETDLAICCVDCGDHVDRHTRVPGGVCHRPGCRCQRTQREVEAAYLTGFHKQIDEPVDAPMPIASVSERAFYAVGTPLVWTVGILFGIMVLRLIAQLIGKL